MTTREIPDIPATRLKESDRWTWRQRRFIQWCALPKEMRPDGLETQRKIGEFLGVGPGTLSTWKTYPGFWDEVYREAKTCIGDEVPAILRSMVEEAKKGSVPAAKLCLECLGVFSGEAAPPVQVREPIIFVINEQRLPSPELQQITNRDNGSEVPVEGEFEIMELVEAEKENG